MNFTPLTEEQLSQPSYEAGEYKFRVTEAEEKVSKTGNPMMVVNLEIIAEGRKPIHIKDYLVATEKGAWKLSSFCKSIGKEGLYKTGAMGIFDIKEQRGNAYFDFEEYEGKKYLKVKYYVEPSEDVPPPVEDESEFGDEIPF